MAETIWIENWIWLFSQLMGLGRIVLSIAGIILCVGILHRLLEEKDAVKLTILGAFLFLEEYVLISAILFRIDSWGITKTLLLEFAVNGTCFGLLLFFGRKAGVCREISLTVRPYIPLFVVCAAALLMAQNAHGYYGMQQDQGVYQTSALAMIYGNSKNEKELTVYHKLLDEDRDRFMQVVPTAVNGLYFYDESLDGLYEVEFTSDSAAYFHGIPTYPALLALWGGMFGLASMTGIQFFLLVLLLAMGYFFLCDLGCGKGMAALGCGIVAVSPIILWVTQSALTEVYLACALMAFLYFLTRKERMAVWLSVAAIASYGGIHLSLYTLMPIVVLIYAGLYLRYQERIYIGAGMLATAAFWFTTDLTRVVSTEYFYKNIEPLIEMLPWLNRENVMGFVTIVCVIVIAVGILTCLIFSKRSAPEKRKLHNGRWNVWLIRILAAALCVLSVIAAVRIGTCSGEGIERQVSASVLGYCVLAGVVMLPAGLAGILIKPWLLWKNRAAALSGVLFFYCILFYSLALRREVAYYYYYGRYLVPFLSLAVWQGLQTLLLLKGKMKVAACAIAAAAQLPLLPYDLVLAAQKDDTRMGWEVLEEICGHVGANDVLIVEDALLSTCYLPLTYMLQADVLPQMQYLPREIMEIYARPDGEVYYLSSGQTELGQSFTVLRSSYTASEDDMSGDRGLLGLPVHMTAGMEYLQLDRLLRTRDTYTAEDDCWINMFYDEDGFRQGYGTEYGLSVYLDSGDYRVTLFQGAAVPVEIYGVEFYPVQVYVNERHLGELRFRQGRETEEIVFYIPASYLQDGENILLFRGEPWKPRDFGKEDYRELGINIKKMMFEKE